MNYAGFNRPRMKPSSGMQVTSVRLRAIAPIFLENPFVAPHSRTFCRAGKMRSKPLEIEDRSGRNRIIAVAVACALAAAVLWYLFGRPARPARHAVSSEELRRAMQQLNQLSTDGIDREFYTESPGHAVMVKVNGAAEDMAKAALLIPEASRKLNLAGKDRLDFERLAQELHGLARDLASQATRDDVPGAKRAMGQLKNTCNSCHERFRIRPETPVEVD
jgi:cytochrome c556